MAQPAVEFRAISKRFPGVVALADVSFTVEAGVCHALCGENGAGKSTLGKLLAGIYPLDEGEIHLGGTPVRFATPADARRAGVAVVHQELAFAENLSVAENLCLGALPRRWGFLDRRTLAARARAMLEAIGADGAPGAVLDVHRTVGGLTVGEQQLVQIAGAVGSGARVIVLDEPTSSLSQREVERLGALIARLKAQGVTMLYVSHRLPEIHRWCEAVTVLRDGHHVLTAPTAALPEAALVQAMIGRELGPETAPVGAGGVRPLGSVRLRVRELASAGRFAGVSFELRAGEILGLAGLVGAGRTDVLQALFGLDAEAGGEIEIDGRAIALPALRRPGAARALGLGLVPEDRKRQGLVPGLSARENLTLPLVATPGLSRAGFVRRGAERALVRAQLERLRVRAASAEVEVAGLSGGNQQKIVLGRWLAAGCKILLLDEPTRGLDVGAKAEVHAIVGELAAAGAAVLVVSSELPELLALADRVLVMREGRIVGEVGRAEMSEEVVMRLMTGTATAGTTTTGTAPPPPPPG